MTFMRCGDLAAASAATTSVPTTGFQIAGRVPAGVTALLLTVSAAAMLTGDARADCSAATPGDDTIICDAVGPDNSPFDALAGVDTIDIIDGVYGGAISGGLDNDTITLDGATIIGDIRGGDGDDTINLLAGTVDDVRGDAIAVTIDAGADTITLNGAVVGDDIQGNAGDDSFTLTSGSFGGDLLGDLGSDTATIASTFSLASIVGNLDGGDDVSNGDGFFDALTIEASGTLTGESVINWEQITISGKLVNPEGGLWLKKGFLWDQDRWADLGALPGYDRTSPSCINDATVIVGTCGKASDPNDARPFIWRDGVIRDLNDLIPPDTGIYLSAARAINQAGQIAGYAIFNVDVVAYLLTPLAPPLGDLNADCQVGAIDLLILLSSWGPCDDCSKCPADFNGDCTVGASDLLILLSNWG